MLHYPLDLTFKLVAINPQIRVTDANGNLVAYVKQKAFRLKEDITIFADEAQIQPLYRLNANRIIDFTATYTITTPSGAVVGSVLRRGMRSLWKATYEINDQVGNTVGLIHEENPWTKVIDGLVGEIPVVGLFSGYMIHPAYLIDLHGQTMFLLKKQPAMFEGRFRLTPREGYQESYEALSIVATIMALLLERLRG